ncbi:NAD(P)/FAD-dependent oxidoreductase [Candidatus Woesearchaeota archaeon]|nr:MAG: NAD(P)/FAD-dependent oxidoreductase [Candidatus Woesearchaeota archaeon]
MISVIGAGPVGSYAAYLLAKKGFDVEIYEEHKEVGKPVACTGILTPQIENLVKLSKDFHINTCNKTKIFSPNGKSVEVKIKPNPIFDRSNFDQYMAQLAVDAGAKLKLNHKFNGLKNNKAVINNKIVSFDYLVGADGPGSKVAKEAGLFGKRKFSVGVQARVSLKSEPDTVLFWVGRGEFAWYVPEDDNVGRLGVASYSNAKMHFDKLLKDHFPKAKILEWQSGAIPIYDPNQKVQKGKVRLVGDAAGQVKATTYGGILFGMLAARELANNLDKYEQNFKKNLGKELNLALRIRKMMDKFSEKDYDDLITLCEKDKVKKILEKHDRDYPSKMLFKLMVAQPGFLKFMKKLV